MRTLVGLEEGGCLEDRPNGKEGSVKSRTLGDLMGLLKGAEMTFGMNFRSGTFSGLLSLSHVPTQPIDVDATTVVPRNCKAHFRVELRALSAWGGCVNSRDLHDVSVGRTQVSPRPRSGAGTADSEGAETNEQQD
jgi:hypothetical protein